MANNSDVSSVSFSHFSITSHPSTPQFPDGSPVHYGPGLHIQNMASQLSTFQQGKHLCDVRITTDGGTEFSAHRVILAAASPYFNTLFSSGFQDSTSGLLELTWMTPTVVERILTFIYMGRILLDHSIVGDILSAAEYLMLPQLKQYCVLFMKSQLMMQNVCRTKYLSDLYGLKDLKQPVDDLLSKNCSGEALQDPHLRDLPVEFIIKLILDDRFKHIREIDIVEFILKWVRHDEENRKEYIPRLMNTVLYDCLPQWYIDRLVDNKLTSEFVSSKLNGRRLSVRRALCDGNPEEDIVLVVSSLSSPPCIGYLPIHDQWVKFCAKLPGSLNLKHRGMKTVCVEKMMYMLVMVEEAMAWLPSGLNNAIRSVHFFRLDVERNTWRDLAVPYSSSKSFHLITCDQSIFALGIQGTMECYDIAKDIWFPCSASTRAIAYFDTLQFTDNNLVYILNVYSTSTETGAGHCLQIYEPKQNKWNMVLLSCSGRGINDLVVLTYRLPGRTSNCQKKGDTLQLYNTLGLHWADIDLQAETIDCWQWNSPVRSKIYDGHGWTLPIPDKDSLFILNSSSNQCAMFDCDTGFSKLTARCPTDVFFGQRSGCRTKINCSALTKLEVVLSPS